MEAVREFEEHALRSGHLSLIKEAAGYAEELNITLQRVSKTPYLGRDNGLVFTTLGPKLGDPVCSCSLSVQEDLTDEQDLIRFLV